MKKDLSRFCTPKYIEKLQAAKPGTKVRILKHWRCEFIGRVYTIGGPHHNRPTGITRNNQTTWVGLEETEDGYILGTQYVFEIIDGRVVYDPKNKPKE